MLPSKTLRIFLFSLIAIVLLSGCDGVEERKAKYMQQAENSLEDRDYDKAILGYKNVIQIDPKDLDARLGLARVLTAQQEWRQAAGQYKGALDVEPNNTEAAIGLGKLYMLARASELAMEQADNVLSREPDNIDALTLKAGVLAQNNDVISALDILESLHQQAPDHIDSSVLLATLLTRSLEHEKAIKVANTTLASHPENVDLHAVLIGVYSNLEQHEKAIATIQKLISIREGEFSQFQRLVAYLNRIGQKSRAKTELEGYIEKHPDNMDARKALVDLYVGQKQFDAAENILTRYIDAFPDEFEFRLGMARIKLIQQDQEAAMGRLNEVIEMNADGPYAIQAKNLKAGIFLATERVDEAKSLYDMVLQDDPANFEALMARGNIALQESRSLDAINDYRSALKNNPDNADITRALARAHLQSGELRLAESYYRQLVTRFPSDLGSRDALARIYKQTGNVGAATELRLELQQKAPNNVANLIELAKLFAASENISDLNKVSETLLTDKSEQTRASGHYFSGLSSQLENDHVSAITQFDSALRLAPKAVEPVSAKVKSLLALDKTSDAIEWLQSRLGGENKNPMLLNLLGEVYILDQDFAQARKHFDLAIASGETWSVPHRNKALSFKAEGDIQKAIAALETGVSVVANASELRLELASLYEADKRIDSAIGQYEILNSQENAPLFAANNLAMLLVTYREDPASLERAAEVAESLRGTTNPLFMDTLAWVYFNRDQVDLALPLMKEAASRAPDVAQINYHLALALHSKQEYGSAMRYLEKALGSEQGFVGKRHAEELLMTLQSQSSASTDA